MISRRNLSGSSRLIPCPGAGPTAALTPAPNGRPARRTRQRHRRRGREKHPFDRSDPRWSVSTDPKAANLGESIFTDEIRPFWLASSSAPYLARRSWPTTRSTPQAPPPGFQLVQCDDEMMRVPPAPEGVPADPRRPPSSSTAATRHSRASLRQVHRSDRAHPEWASRRGSRTGRFRILLWPAG